MQFLTPLQRFRRNGLKWNKLNQSLADISARKGPPLIGNGRPAISARFWGDRVSRPRREATSFLTATWRIWYAISHSIFTPVSTRGGFKWASFKKHPPSITAQKRRR